MLVPSEYCLEIAHRIPVDLGYIMGSVAIERLSGVRSDKRKSNAKPSKRLDIGIEEPLRALWKMELAS